MPWNGSAPNQTFGRTDGISTGDNTWQQAAAAPRNIEADDHDTHDTDIKDGINACVKKDGGNTATAALPMGGFNHTNVGVATARTHYARFSQVQDNAGQYVATVGGTADVITLTPSPAITAYAAGQRFSFIAGGTNTGATTVNVSGVGAKDIKRPDGSATALSAGDIISGTIVDIEYDGTQFLLLNAGLTALTTLDINGGTAETAPAVADLVPIYDASVGANRKMTLANLLKVINLLTAETAPAVDDELALYDADGAATDKITLANLLKVVNALTEDTSPNFANDFILTYDASASAAKKVKLGIGAVVAIIEDQKTQNTAAQSLSSGSDQVRELTTLAYNRDTLVSLSSNRFTLPAGTWEIEWESPVYAAVASGVTGLHQSLLYNQTDSAEVARGSSGRAHAENGSGLTIVQGPPVSRGSSVVTIAGSKAFEIRHRVGTTSLGGIPANFGTEVYTRVTVRRA
jgi:hypothetical protein